MFTVPPRRWGGPANDERRSKPEVNADKRTNVKLLAAVLGGSAVVAMGALTMAISQEQAPATITGSSMTLGATSTQKTPPAVPETSLAVPVVKAKPYGGSGS
jgi:hypothetical protein